MSDVVIDYVVLNELNGSLKQIIVEFNDASKRSGSLMDAIGKPAGRDNLRNAAHNFESGWDDRRAKLLEDIEKVQQHVEKVGSGWAKWDTEAAQSLSVDKDAASKLPTK